MTEIAVNPARPSPSHASSVTVAGNFSGQLPQKFGLPPTCGCAERQRWLNKFGETFGVNHLLGKILHPQPEPPPPPDAGSSPSETPPPS